MTDDQTLINRQLAREKAMADHGKARAQAHLTRALERGNASDTPAGVALAKRAIQPLVEAIDKFLEAAATGGAGRRHTAVSLMKGVPTDLAAFLTIKAGINGASRRATLKTAAIDVANSLMDELLAAEFEMKEKALYQSIVRNATLRGLSAPRIANSVNLANRKFNVVEERWSKTQRLVLGTKLLELAVEAVGIFSINQTRNGANQQTYILALSDQIDGWFKEFNQASTLARPVYLPTVIPPQPWTQVTGSPYYGNGVRSRGLLMRSFDGQPEALAEAQMDTVYSGLNSVQNTPWRINRRVLEVMEAAWNMDAGLTCLPPREDIQLPEAPIEVVQDEKGGPHRKAWRAKMRAIHEANAASRSNRFEFARCLAIARDYKDEEAMYFPHRLDFRGRCYASATSLSPQGADHARGLLEFAVGKPLGERGLFWLGVHGANVFGNDKVSLEDRYQWAEAHYEQAREVARDPLGNLWWTEADKPWSFLAWCFEWAESDLNYDYVSRMPIALDGSCNGIQHFSAMLRDPVGGAAVNLVPSDKPQDIYGRVAERAIELMKDEQDPEKQWIAQAWVAWGINRKITKRAVMVLPYGGTFKSCMDYVREAVREKIKDGAENPFGTEAFQKACSYLAARVWEAIGQTVVAAREAMTWLQAVARASSKAGMPLRWTTPSGFIVFQDYREIDSRRIHTRFQGGLVKFASVELSDEIDRSKQASAVAPNFVHSLDASAMMLTIEACRAQGITSFAMIHDSYGTHAADTDALAETLRAEFVRMYSDHDVLAEFLAEAVARLPEAVAAELPPIPAKGMLELSEVLKSDYFFA